MAASRHDSVSSWTMRCRRLAPIESRMAISPARPAERASSRLAMFAQAMRMTKTVTPRSRVSPLRASRATDVCPRAPFSTVIAFARNFCMVWSLMPVCSGASTSFMTGLVRDVDGRPRLLERHARLEPGEQINPVTAAILERAGPRPRHHLVAQRDGHEHERPRAERRARESLGRDADDRHRLTVDGHRLIHHAGVAAEAGRPVGVAQHHHPAVVGDLVIVWPDESSEGRLEAQRRKVTPRDEDAVAVDRGLSLDGEVGAHQDMARDPCENCLFPLEIPEHRVAENLIAVAGLIAGVASGFRRRRAEVDEAIRFRHRPAAAAGPD